MKHFLLLAVVILSSGCSKVNSHDVSACFTERDKLSVQLRDSQTELNLLKMTMESQIKQGLKTKEKELNVKIESYEQLVGQIKSDNQNYRRNLRWILILSFLGAVAGIVSINIALLKKFKRKKEEKKLYEEK